MQKKSNNENRKENILYSCEITPPEQFIPSTIETDFEIPKVNSIQIKEIQNKISGVNLIPDVINNISEIKFDKNNKIEIEFLPKIKNRKKALLPNKIYFDEIQPVYKTSINSSLNFNSEKSIKNISPFGIWKLKLQNSSTDPSFRRQDILKDIFNVAITIKIAVRKIN